MPQVRYVAGLLFSSDEKRVALIRKSKPSWQCGKLNGVGGKIEPGETPEVAIVREFREETGAEGRDWRRFCTLVGPLFLVEFFTAHQDVELRSVTEEPVGWYWVQNVITGDYACVPNLKWLIAMALDRDLVSGVVSYQ